MVYPEESIFDSFYLSVSEVVENFSTFAIMKYINATGRLNTTTEWQDWRQVVRINLFKIISLYKSSGGKPYLRTEP